MGDLARILGHGRQLRLFSIAAVLSALLALPSPALGQSPSPWFGTWQVNLTKSTYPAGPPAFKRMTCTIEPWEGDVRVTYEMIGTRGGITHLEWVGKLDGNDYPLAGLDGYTVSHAYRPIDAHTYEVVQREGGSITSRVRMTLSPDNKTLAVYTPRQDAQGRPVVTITVYDRR